MLEKLEKKDSAIHNKSQAKKMILLQLLFKFLTRYLSKSEVNKKVHLDNALYMFWPSVR